MKYIACVFIIVSAIACNPGADNDAFQTGTQLNVPVKKAPLVRCYQWKEGRTVAQATFTFYPNDSVAGPLEYLFAEKDQSRGYFKGKLLNDRLTGFYTFQSEGKTSEMEVIFELQGDKLVQGHGPMSEKNGRMVYQHPEQASFSTPFQAVICPAEYK